jgi:hypothetical protein
MLSGGIRDAQRIMWCDGPVGAGWEEEEEEEGWEWRTPWMVVVWYLNTRKTSLDDNDLTV